MIAEAKCILTIDDEEQGYQEFSEGEWVDLRLANGDSVHGEITSISYNMVTVVEDENEQEVMLKDIAGYF